MVERREIELLRFSPSAYHHVLCFIFPYRDRFVGNIWDIEKKFIPFFFKLL